MLFLVCDQRLLVGEGLPADGATESPASGVLALVGVQVAGFFEALVAEPARVRPLVCVLSLVPDVDAHVGEDLTADFARDGPAASSAALWQVFQADWWLVFLKTQALFLNSVPLHK